MLALMWLNGIFWFAVVPAAGIALASNGADYGIVFLGVGWLVGAFTQGRLSKVDNPVDRSPGRHVGWGDPGSGGGPD